MRKAETTAFTATLAGLLAAIAVSAALAQEGEKQLYEAAKKEGQLTWSTAHYDQQLSNQIGNAFTAKYPGIKVNVIKATAQVGFQRLLQAGIRPGEKNPGDRYSAAVWAASRCLRKTNLGGQRPAPVPGLGDRNWPRKR